MPKKTDLSALTDNALHRRCQELMEQSSYLLEVRRSMVARWDRESLALDAYEQRIDANLVAVYDEIDDRRERAEEAADYAEVARGTGHRHG